MEMDGTTLLAGMTITEAPTAIREGTVTHAPRASDEPSRDHEDGIRVRLDGASDDLPGTLLHTSERPWTPRTGERVLALLREADPTAATYAIVLGRLGEPRARAHVNADAAREAEREAEREAGRGADANVEDAPDELVMEARKNLVLRCGAGSITLRADGKVLIRGKDLVARARRTHRIKGGSVAIN